MHLCMCDVLQHKTTTRNDVIIMFNNYARIDDEFEMTTNEYHFNEYVVEMIIEQLFATCFDDIYTMHIYQNKNDNTKFIVDVAFELHTQIMQFDDDNDEFEKIHSYDMRVNIDISNDQFDTNEICNTIEFVAFEIVHRNAYITRDYNANI